jgi:preprotein translocase subunit SecF
VNEEGDEGVTAFVREALMTEEEKQLNAVGKLNLNDASEKRMTDFFVTKGIETEVAADTASKLIGLITRNPKGLITDFSEIETLGLKKRVMRILKEDTFLGSFIFLSTESVGPQVGHDLRGKATRAVIYALLGMLIYIGVRFRFIFGIAAAITLIHDVLIALTFILLFHVEVNLHVVAAILTIVGYSLNDTIVIFDRVRDNLKLMRRENSEKILDRSINQTLSRTIVTSGTTLCTVLALFFFGGEVIHAFSFTLMVGVIIGTYSSIFQSCAWLRIWEKKLLGRKKK